tara:strand:- start:2744 stop:2983 length:240 start_codon:yes stop_codon:yes gene_type:complete
MAIFITHRKPKYLASVKGLVATHALEDTFQKIPFSLTQQVKERIIGALEVLQGEIGKVQMKVCIVRVTVGWSRQIDSRK